MDAGTGPFTVGHSVGQRYAIRGLVGSGGMGTVYEAWDRELGIAVALKVIRPEVGTDPQAARELERRFKRELLLARQVTHRNVVRIHDLGEVDGIKYITMPLIRGTDLRTRLRSSGKLSVSDALSLSRQIVAGLKAAHEAGVVHRDLKPANIMLDASGQALIMDFGLARFTGARPIDAAAEQYPSDSLTVSSPLKTAPAHASDPTPLTAPTEVQGIVGTLAYMAPEQARGEPADHRADIFAFGMILFEMLTGRRAAPEGLDRLAAMQQRITEQPVSLRQIDPAIPPAVDAIAVRCFQLDASRRYQTTADLAAALEALDSEGRPRRRLGRSLAVGAVAGVLISAAAVTFWPTGEGPAAPPRPVQLLIASFANTTGEAGLESTMEQALGLTLEGATFISTYSRRSALQLAEQMKLTGQINEVNARLIAIREGLDAVVVGSVEPRNGGYRISVRTVDSEGAEISKHVVDAAGKGDLLTAVTRVASLVRDDLGDSTPASVRQKDVETFTTASLDAVNEYVQAQNLASEGSYDEAIEHYRAALKHDPGFGRAYSGWAVTAFRAGRIEEASEAYQKAFAAIGSMTEREKLRTYGAYYLQFKRNYEKAIENYHELIARFPFDRAGHSNLAIAYFGTLDFRKALEEGQRAIDLYPRDPTFRTNYALFAMYAGEFQTASAEGRRTTDTSPGAYKAYLPVSVAAIDAGDFELARNSYGRMAATGVRGASMANSGLADLAMYHGRPEEAVTLLRPGLAADDKAALSDNAATKQIALAEALAALGKIVEARSQALAVVKRSKTDGAQVSAARLLGRIGGQREAERIATELGNQLQTQSRAYGRIVNAELAIVRGDYPLALSSLREARKSADLWLSRFLLGVTYVQGGSPTEALSELETAWKRRGEATALFLDDLPTFRYVAPVQYWLGRAHHALNALPAARQHYETFLKLRPSPSQDPLAVDAAKRLQSLAR